jgi:hypothetical protein
MVGILARDPTVNPSREKYCIIFLSLPPTGDLVNQPFFRKLKESLEDNFSGMGELISATSTQL